VVIPITQDGEIYKMNRASQLRDPIRRL